MKVFVSSTIRDLEPERSEIDAVLKAIQYESYLSESDGADWTSSYTKCVNEIDKSDIYILIIGERYGFIPERQSGTELLDGVTSVTHAEFKHAARLNKPTLIYEKTLTKREKQEKDFLDELKNFYSGLSVRKFSNPTMLANYVRKDVINLLTKLVRGEYRYPLLNRPNVILCDSRNDLFNLGSEMIITILQSAHLPVFGFMPGRTAGGIYEALASKLSNMEVLESLKHMRAFHVAEHFGVTGQSPCSYEHWMNMSLYERIEAAQPIHLDRSKIHFIPGAVSGGSLAAECASYDAMVSSHTIHLQLMGLAPNGQSMSIDPDTNLTRQELLDQQTSLVQISQETFNYLRPQPPIPFSITIGMGNVLKFARRIAIFAFGNDKAAAVKNLLTTADYNRAPCSILLNHSDLWVVIDKQAASHLPNRWTDFYSPITSQEFFSKLKDIWLTA
jgi:glucosamine-6-phosphate deaminase